MKRFVAEEREKTKGCTSSLDCRELRQAVGKSGANYVIFHSSQVAVLRSGFALWRGDGPGTPSRPPGHAVIREELWVSAIFTDTGQEVMSFLQRAVDGVEGITAELRKYL
jgi:hypothetical protein